MLGCSEKTLTVDKEYGCSCYMKIITECLGKTLDVTKSIEALATQHPSKRWGAL